MRNGLGPLGSHTLLFSTSHWKCVSLTYTLWLHGVCIILKGKKTKTPTRLVTNRINTSEWNLNQSSAQETPGSCCYFLNAFIGCRFFPTLPFSFIEFSYNEFAMTITGCKNNNKKLQLDPVLASAATKANFFLKPSGKHWGREGGKKERLIPKRVCSISKDATAKHLFCVM